MSLLAATELGNDALEGLGEIGTGVAGLPLAGATKAGAFGMFRSVLSLAIGVITVVGFIWFFFLIVTAAITWMSSGGEKNKIQDAQKRITNGIIGIVLLISATFLIKVLETILGIEILKGVWDILP